MFDLSQAQAALREQGLDGWLLYDFRGSNILAARITGTAEGHRTRRWAYYVPAEGSPTKLVHKIEPAALDHLPGDRKIIYLRWEEWESGIGELVSRAGRVAMEYTPRNGNPYISRVDAGTVELVRSFGPEVVSSGDLVQEFEATWDESQWQMHLEAAVHTDSAFEAAWAFIAQQIRERGYTTETAVQKRILDHFAEHGLVTDHPPIVGVWEHAGDPHFAPSRETDKKIEPGSFVLVDLWAKLDRPRAVYSDLTRVAFVGETVPERVKTIFQLVAQARDAAIDRVIQAFAAGDPLQGWQVDFACRDVIEQAGYGAYFIHRTGHNIGQETHGNGANMDGLETREERRVMRRTCFSVEPGIYLPEFGVRSEVNVYVDSSGQVHVTGGDRQTEVRCIVI
ncbi:MAG: M24 family metallopeptidase [Bacteroidales bacterium]|nr:M24 family metallopeptidase [Bacteroidales bacterium]